MDKEYNSGYEIIQKLTVGETIVALGEMKSDYGTKYVTWEARKDAPTDYFWGHYIAKFHDAQEDLYKRAAEISQRINPNYYKKMEEKLPDKCFSVLKSSGELILINKGKSGYVPFSSNATHEETRLAADDFNEAMGVTKAQEQAMVSGSMFGWDTPAANPKNYDVNGNAINPKTKTDKETER